MNTLKAEKRSMDVKAKKLRREGYVVGNVFGREIEGSIPVKMEKREADSFLRAAHKGSQVILDIEGQKYNTLVKEIAYNPLKGRVDEIDFQALVSNEKVHSVAEVVILNHDKVVEGVLQEHLEEVAYQAYPSALVDRVEVDAANLKIGDVVRVKDLSIAKDSEIELKTDPETVVVSVVAVRNAALPEAEETTEAETAETEK